MNSVYRSAIDEPQPVHQQAGEIYRRCDTLADVYKLRAEVTEGLRDAGWTLKTRVEQAREHRDAWYLHVGRESRSELASIRSILYRCKNDEEKYMLARMRWAHRDGWKETDYRPTMPRSNDDLLEEHNARIRDLKRKRQEEEEDKERRRDE